MPWSTIVKSSRDWETVPNLHDYGSIHARFTWEQARQDLEGLRDNQGLNIAHEAIDRHANGARASHLAIRWLGKNGTIEDYSYGQLQDLTNRFANLLSAVGVARGDRVFVLADAFRSSTSLRSGHSRTVVCSALCFLPSALSRSEHDSISARRTSSSPPPRCITEKWPLFVRRSQTFSTSCLSERTGSAPPSRAHRICGRSCSRPVRPSLSDPRIRRTSHCSTLRVARPAHQRGYSCPSGSGGSPHDRQVRAGFSQR